MKTLLILLWLVQPAWAQDPAPDPRKPDLQAGYDGGFFIQGKEGRFTLEGLFQVNGVFFERGASHESEFVIRRMRLEFSGEFFERWQFHIEPKFMADSVELEEAWVGLQLDTQLVIFGRMKEPFSLEEMGSVRHQDMINLSIMNGFVPAEDHGITVLGSSGMLEFGLGFYNGTGGEDTNSGKDVALRLVLHPGMGFQFGGAATIGRQEKDVSGDELRNEARAAWAEFLPGTAITDQRIRIGAEAAFLDGPFAATAEIIRIRENLNGTTVRFTGGYLQASWVLTGEGKSWKGDPVRKWKGVKPDRPFLEDPARGAWQLVARWSRLGLEDEMIPFLSTYPGRIDSATAGVNWYANEFVKIKLNFLRTLYEKEITIASRAHDREDALLFQFQIMF